MGRSWSMVLMLVIGGLLASCLHHTERRTGPRLSDIDGEASVLKLHLAGGEVYVLSKWRMSNSGKDIRGRGQKWSPARRLLADGDHVVALQEVKRFETNTQQSSSGANFAFGVLTTATVAVLGAVVYFIVGLSELEDGAH